MYQYLMSKILALTPEEQESDQGIALIAEAFSCAPPEIKKLVDAKMKELDLLPEAEFIDDAGTVYFSAESVAKKLGVTVDEVKKRIQEVAGNPTEYAAEPVGGLHRLH